MRIKKQAIFKGATGKARDERYIDLLRKDDIHFRKEYAGQTELKIVVSDIEYVNEITLNLGNAVARVFHTVSPHSENTTCVYIPEEKVLFLGDAASEDFSTAAIWTRKN